MRFRRLAVALLAALLLLAACASDPVTPAGDAAPSVSPHTAHSAASPAPPVALREGERFVDLKLPKPYVPAAPTVAPTSTGASWSIRG